MPQRRTTGYHDTARDRLVPVTPITDLWPPPAKGLPAPQRTYAAYQAVLQQHWRGQATMHDVLCARAAWCQACSQEVERRRLERKPLEGHTGRGWRKAG